MILIFIFLFISALVLALHQSGKAFKLNISWTSFTSVIVRGSLFYSILWISLSASVPCKLSAQYDTLAFKEYYNISHKNLYLNLDSSHYYLKKAQSQISRKVHPELMTKSLKLESSILRYKGKNKQSFSVLNDALAICVENNLTSLKANILMTIGIDHKNNRNHDIAEQYFDEALKIAEEISDSLMISNLLFSYATLYQADMKFEKAIVYYQKSIEIDKALDKEQELGGTFANLAMIYEDLNEIDKAAHYYHEAINLNKKYENYIGLMKNYINLGSFLYQTKNHTEAIKYLNKADSLMLAMKFEAKEYFHIIYTNQFNCYFELNEWKKANELGLKILKDDPDNHIKITILKVMATLKAEQNDCDSAIYYLNSIKELDLDALFSDEQFKYHKNVSTVYELCNDFSNAYHHLAMAYHMRDSLFVESDRKNAKEADAKYQASQKEKENQKLSFENAISKAKLRSKNTLLIGGGFFLLSMILMSGFLYKSNIDRKKLNDDLATSNKRITLLHRESLHRNQNQLAMATSLVSLQKSQLAFKKPEEIMSEIESKLRAISAVNKRLADNDLIKISKFDELMEEVISNNVFSFDAKKIRVHVNADDIEIRPDALTSLTLLTNELSVNSIKHAFSDTTEPEIHLDIRNQDNNVIYHYYDNGTVKKNNQKGEGTGLILGLIDQLSANYKLSTEKNYSLTLELTR